MAEALLDETLLEDSTDAAAVRAERLDAAGAAWAERIAGNPASASLTFTANGRGTGSVATEVTAGRHRFTVDEPAALAGDDAAASPVEYALGALISCQVVVYRLYARQLGIRVDGISITADADLDVRGFLGFDDSVRPGFSAVRLRVNITGPETPERYAELQAAVDARCPVLDVFANPVPVTIELAVEAN